MLSARAKKQWKNPIYRKRMLKSIKISWNKSRRKQASIRIFGEKHPMWGKHHSFETKEKIGNAHRGEKHYNWKGGKKKDKSGYILIYKPEHPYARRHSARYGNRKYITEHRLIIEKFIRRFLFPEEHVHHLGKKDDNRPHMLMAFSSNSAHKRFEGKGHITPEEIIFDGRKLKH
jgi:hypothetical protein